MSTLNSFEDTSAAPRSRDTALSNAVRRYQNAALSPSTVRGYSADWAHFTAWCALREEDPLPADAACVANYLADLADARDMEGAVSYANGSIERRVSAIRKAHHIASLPSPTESAIVTSTMAGVRRRVDAPRVQRARPLMLDDLRAICDTFTEATWPKSVVNMRDHALLLCGFNTASRRSEIAALTASDVTLHPSDGLIVTVRRSKTDQEGRGIAKAIPRARDVRYCAPCAYMRWAFVRDGADADGRSGAMRAIWLHAAPSKHACRSELPVGDDRPAFRSVRANGFISARALSGRAVSEVVKRRVAEVGVDPTYYSGHSLRAGFVTEAFRAGADAAAIMRQTGHRSSAMVEVYRREHSPLVGNAVAMIRV